MKKSAVLAMFHWLRGQRVICNAGGDLHGVVFQGSSGYLLACGCMEMGLYSTCISGFVHLSRSDEDRYLYFQYLSSIYTYPKSSIPITDDRCLWHRDATMPSTSRLLPFSGTSFASTPLVVVSSVNYAKTQTTPEQPESSSYLIRGHTKSARFCIKT